MDDRKISICIPTFERDEMLLDSFRSVHDDERVSEVVIVDDCSRIEQFNRVAGLLAPFKKVRLFRNAVNKDCYANKMESLFRATNDFCILLDSDNIIDIEYLDKIYEFPEWDAKIAYMPSFARPLFSYVAYEGVTFDKSNIAEYIDKPMVSTCLNCTNYFVNRHEYARVWQDNIVPHTADSILQNYNWLNAGNGIHVVPGLSYYHRVHDGSHYKQNVHKTGRLYAEIEQKIKILK